MDIPANYLTVTKSEWVDNDPKESKLTSGLLTGGNEKTGELEITISVDVTWDNSQISIVRPYLFLTFMNQHHSKKKYRKVLKKVTVKELEDMVLRLFCDKKDTDISLVITSDQIKFHKIGSNKDVSIGEILLDEQVGCYLENKSDFSICFPVNLRNTEIGKGYGDKI